MNIFVTGGTGFIGSYVVKELLSHGHALTLLARNANKVPGFTGHERIRFVTGTMGDSDAIAEGLEGQDACVHVALSWLDGTAIENAVNETLPSIRLFQAAAEAGVGKIVYTSSIASFGSAPNDDRGYIKPSSYYGATKAATEAYLMAIAQQYRLQANIVRPGYTFGNPCVEGGPLYPDLKLVRMVRSAMANEPMSFVKHDGTQFIWAGDLAKVYAELLHSDELNRGYYTAVSTEFRTWAEIAQMAVDLMGSGSRIVLEDKGRPDPGAMPIDVSQIKQTFGFAFKADAYMKEHLRYLGTLDK
ncbi:NAD-dependent epimerase/dehydratase family protein [Paenibacillus glycinis]|uniref:NAD-dependent epimerase/dehydratase family protein n=1 Tax=Paenibacillus glycinis TaxID=2697035 RepID=A0ABW9XK18_9BACL|nr:NAD(P)-dependent oxidoreductase [Paenibacillus glycinis]NBD22951.1 NAD-dependent epimerase/dehydratase family protein [Paenibacillus glycinis]